MTWHMNDQIVQINGDADEARRQGEENLLFVDWLAFWIKFSSAGECSVKL